MQRCKLNDDGFGRYVTHVHMKLQSKNERMMKSFPIITIIRLSLAPFEGDYSNMRHQTRISCKNERGVRLTLEALGRPAFLADNNWYRTCRLAIFSLEYPR